MIRKKSGTVRVFVLKIGTMGSIVLVVFVYLLHLLNRKMVGQPTYINETTMKTQLL